MSNNFRRRIVEAYKEDHWHTYWHAKFECGHWGLAPNRRNRERYPFGHSDSAICDECKRAKASYKAQVLAGRNNLNKPLDLGPRQEENGNCRTYQSSQEATMTNVTANEIKVLEYVRDSEYQDWLEPAHLVDHHVWTEYINPFSAKRTFSGVVSSLVQKGLVSVYTGTTNVTGNDPGTIALTQAGVDILFPKTEVKKTEVIRKTKNDRSHPGTTTKGVPTSVTTPKGKILSVRQYLSLHACRTKMTKGNAPECEHGHFGCAAWANGPCSNELSTQ